MGFYFLSKGFLLLNKLRTISLLNHLNLYIICYKHNIQSYTDIKTKIIRWHNLFLSLDDNSNGRPFLPTNSSRALKHRLLRTLKLALVSLAELGAAIIKYQSRGLHLVNISHSTCDRGILKNTLNFQRY